MNDFNILKEIGIGNISEISHFTELNTGETKKISVFFVGGVENNFEITFEQNDRIAETRYEQIIKALHSAIKTQQSARRKNLDPYERYGESRLNNIRECLDQFAH